MSEERLFFLFFNSLLVFNCKLLKFIDGFILFNELIISSLSEIKLFKFMFSFLFNSLIITGCFISFLISKGEFLPRLNFILFPKKFEPLSLGILEIKDSLLRL